MEHILGYNVDCPVTQASLEFHQNPEKFKQTSDDKDAIKKAVMAPRGHSKTVSWTISPTLWRAFGEKGKQIIISSASNGQSKDILELVKRIIMRNEALQHLEPSPENLERLGEHSDINRGEDSWAAQSITTTTDVQIKVKTFGSSIRSKHVDYVFLDDVLQDEGQGTRNVEQEKDTFYNVVSPIIENKDGILQIVGTPMSHNDLLMELMDKDSYSTNYYQAYNEETREPLWNSNWTYESLMEKKNEVGPARFAREYMCVEEGTPIQMEHGLRKIENIEKGEKVLTHEGNYKQVLNTFDNGKKDVLKIKTPGYSDSMGLTHNHPVRTTEGWKNVEELTENDYLVSPRIYGGETMDKDILRLYGWYVAEGSIGANGRAVRLCTNSAESDKVAEIVRNAGYKPKFYGGKTEKVEPITINSKDLATELEKRFGRAKDKKVWSKIHDLDLEHQKIFLKAYLNGDGHNPKEGVYSSRSVVRNVSESMARIATALGWTVTRDYDNEGTDFKYEGRECEGADYHRVRYYQNPRRAQITDDYIAYPVDSIEEGGTVQTHNLEVEDDNSYHLPMFAVHNCNPMSVEEQFFSEQDCIKPNLDDTHFKPNTYQQPYNDWSYYVSVDIAMSDKAGADYTVFTVIGVPKEGEQKHIVDIVREKGMSPRTIADKLEQMDSKYGFSRGLVEKNSIGEGVAKEIQLRDSLSGRIKFFDTTRTTRPKILSNLQAALHRGELTLPSNSYREGETLIDELSAFHMNSRGKLEGKGHDDTVMSLAIGYELIGNNSVASATIIGGDDEDNDNDDSVEDGIASVEDASSLAEVEEKADVKLGIV